MKDFKIRIVKYLYVYKVQYRKRYSFFWRDFKCVDKELEKLVGQKKPLPRDSQFLILNLFETSRQVDQFLEKFNSFEDIRRYNFTQQCLAEQLQTYQQNYH